MLHSSVSDCRFGMIIAPLDAGRLGWNKVLHTNAASTTRDLVANGIGDRCLRRNASECGSESRIRLTEGRFSTRTFECQQGKET